MAKKKIVILGGGMAGLSAAYELTKTDELRAQHEVTLYQMGWRLGGKATSGRDQSGRSLEHGLHVWFGCYENVFRMIQEIYRVWTPPPGCPIKDWRDVARPQVYTPIGVQQNGKWTYFPLEWPIRGGMPGDGHEIVWTPWEAMKGLTNLFIRVVRDAAGEHAKLRANKLMPEPAPTVGVPAMPFGFAAVSGESSPLDLEERGRAHSLWHGSKTSPLSFEHYAEAAHLWTKYLLADNTVVDPQSVEHIADLYNQAFKHVDAVAKAAKGPSQPEALGATRVGMDLKFRLVAELVNIFNAVTRGYFLDLLLPDLPFETLDHMDLREWLIHHGADADIVNTSSVLRVVYDTLFQYKDGKVEQPSYAAGTALGVIARLLVTYKNAMMWDIQAGMGEAVIAPLYEVLCKRGVRFRFFHKVTKLELSQDKKSIEKVRIKRQAKIRIGEYDPLKTFNNLKCWPHEPDWQQLDVDPRWNGKHPDFENHWLDGPAVGPEVELVRGSGSDTGFDTIVLAISMGAYKPLGNGELGMCDALIANSGAFSDFVNKIDIVPTQSLQIWSDKTLAELGWTSGKPATVSGPEYLNIWADMSQVIEFEAWPRGSKPKSLHYLCGTLATEQYKQPSTNTRVPEAVREQVRQEQIDWLNAYAYANWPNAWDDEHRFHFNVLTDPSNQTGANRFKAQYYRANISPTECCVLSRAGTTQYRLHPFETGFDNLIVAGEATRHGFNTTAIEGAVMSGMAASWAICRSPKTIPGYDFLQRKPSQREGELDIRAPDTTGAALPPYIEAIGHGAASLAPPARFTGVKAHFFTVAASTPAMQKLADTFLKQPGGGRVKYQVSMPRALVSFLDIERCTSLADSIGWVPGRECAIWVPLLEIKTGRLPRPVLWSPYIFINYTIGMVTGREVWGWPKTHAEITVPRDAIGGAGRFTCETTIFKTLGPTSRGESLPLFTVTTDAPLRRSSGPFAKAGDALRCFANVLSRAATPFVSGFGLPMISAVALKQFRHSLQVDRACYQAIVDSPIRMTRFGGGGLLAGNFKLNITTCESHQIAEDIFGIRPMAHGTIVPVEHAGWAELDFDAMPGKVIVSSEQAS